MAEAVYAVIGAVGGLLIGALVVVIITKFRSNSKLSSTERLVAEMKANAENECKALKKEAIVELKEQELKLRTEFEKESREKRAELQKMEQRLNQKDETLNKKDANLLKRNEEVEAMAKSLENKHLEADGLIIKLKTQHELFVQELEKVAQMTQDEAKTMIIEEVKDEARKEASLYVRNQEQQAKDEADKKAKEIISLAIQRCAVDQSNELTVTTISIPNDDMKARLIGREGRNITALENATGIRLIIDDTPEVVVASGFDPVRREVARRALEKLISDGRIQPTRIEETVDKVKKDLDVIIKESGENAVFEMGLYGIHPELIKILGKLKFRTSYGQNVLQHSLEVAHIAGLMAQELGVDVTLAKRGGLLHDIGKAVDFENEGTHINLGVELAKKYKENKFVINCIESHHGDVEPKCIEAVLVQAADAISGVRPGARKEIESTYIKRLEQLEDIASDFKGVEKAYAIQAGREVRVIVRPEQIDDSQALFLAKDIAKKIESSMEYPGQIKVNVIRESRSVEYAK
ncbi:MAG: ribonuclease Y [Clostridia bacterium]|nr:ribonuclease Y [Clostridia bacterium]